LQEAEHRRGFTLIELSIVLVIIGLIVGGVLLGQSLIRAAQIQSVTADVTTYSHAIQLFREKYNSLPGDMANATSYWGANSGSAAQCTVPWYSAPTSSTSTCNGNGDGHINGGYGTSGASGNNITDEQFLMWQHLANAGMIQGSFTGQDNGIPGDPSFTAAAPARGADVPLSKVPGGYYAVATNLDWWGPNGATWVYPWTSVNHIISFMGNAGPPLTASEALSVDTKIDDGRPGTGSVKTARTGSQGCGVGLAKLRYELRP